MFFNCRGLARSDQSSARYCNMTSATATLHSVFKGFRLQVYFAACSAERLREAPLGWNPSAPSNVSVRVVTSISHSLPVFFLCGSPKNDVLSSSSAPLVNLFVSNHRLWDRIPRMF